MNDHTQVEVDMGTVQKVFAYASDTIVEASKLRQDFAQLRVEVDGLRDELSRLRRQNEFMDEQLVNVRRSRDEAHGKIHELEGTLHQRNERIQVLERQVDEAVTTKHMLNDNLTSVSVERDDAQLRVMELEEENKTLKLRIEQVQKQADAILSVLRPNTQVAPAGSVEPSADVTEVKTFDEAERRPGETEEEHRQRTQPRDPVTQQWRSPYGEEAVAAKPEDSGWH